MIISLVIVVGLAAIAAVLSRNPVDHTPEELRAWEDAASNEDSAVGRILLNVAKPVSRSTLLKKEASSPAYQMLERRLVASGAYSSSVEVFLAVQIVSFFVGSLVLAATIGSNPSGALPVIAGVMLAAGITALPYNQISKKAKAREEAVLEALPDFSELLQMPLASGMGVLPALSFTADRVDGIVSDEVKKMTLFIANNPSKEAEGFLLAGERLGTPEAKSFFAAMLQAQVEGSRVMESLASHSEALRKKAFERSRADAKKLPVKLVLMFGMHFLPLLFILALLPVFLSFGEVL